jgi:hypothetical protein
VFDSKKDGAEVNRLRKKNQELTEIIGSLTVIYTATTQTNLDHHSLLCSIMAKTKGG